MTEEAQQISKLITLGFFPQPNLRTATQESFTFKHPAHKKICKKRGGVGINKYIRKFKAVALGKTG